MAKKRISMEEKLMDKKIKEMEEINPALFRTTPVFVTPTHGPRIDLEARDQAFQENWGKENVDWDKEQCYCQPRKSIHTPPIPSNGDIREASLMIYSH